MKTTLLLIIAVLATSVSLTAGPKALVEASASFRSLVDPLLAKELSRIGTSEEQTLRLELDRLFRNETLMGALWHQARRSQAVKDKVENYKDKLEDYRQSSLTCLSGIEQGVPAVMAALAKTRLSVPEESLKARSRVVLSLAAAYREELTKERFPVDEEPNKAPEPTP